MLIALLVNLWGRGVDFLLPEMEGSERSGNNTMLLTQIIPLPVILAIPAPRYIHSKQLIATEPPTRLGPNVCLPLL
jgi:hypothetical protein